MGSGGRHSDADLCRHLDVHSSRQQAGHLRHRVELDRESRRHQQSERRPECPNRFLQLVHRAMNKRRPPRRNTRGFSIVELMVATSVSVFLLAGLFSIMQSTHKTSDNEKLMAQLQDDERIAMTMIATVIEETAYYSSPLTVALTTGLPASANFPQAGQAVT